MTREQHIKHILDLLLEGHISKEAAEKTLIDMFKEKDGKVVDMIKERIEAEYRKYGKSDSINFAETAARKIFWTFFEIIK